MAQPDNVRNQHTTEDTPWRNKQTLKTLYVEQSLSAREVAQELDCGKKTVLTWLSKHDIPTRDSSRQKTLPECVDDPEWLREQYHVEGKSQQEVADYVGVSRSVISNRMRKHGIERDNVGRGATGPWQDKPTLYELYVEENLNIHEVAEKLDTGAPVIYTWLEKHGISIRPQSEAQSKPLIDRDVLAEKYHGCGMSLREIAADLDRSPINIRHLMEKHGIERRDKNYRAHKRVEKACEYCGGVMKVQPSDTDRKFCDMDCRGRWQEENLVGKNHPAWKGGHDEYYGAGWEKQRQKCLERDGYECRACGMTQEEHRDEFGTGLNVHHIVPHREFEDNKAANDLGNLVTACRSCHSRFEGLPVFPP